MDGRGYGHSKHRYRYVQSQVYISIQCAGAVFGIPLRLSLYHAVGLAATAAAPAPPAAAPAAPAAMGPPAGSAGAGTPTGVLASRAITSSRVRPRAMSVCTGEGAAGGGGSVVPGLFSMAMAARIHSAVARSVPHSASAMAGMSLERTMLTLRTVTGSMNSLTAADGQRSQGEREGEQKQLASEILEAKTAKGAPGTRLKQRRERTV